MKKIISLVAALSMAATMMVSFTTVHAERVATTVDVKATVMTNDEYKAIANADIPAGAAAYTIEVDLSGIDADGYGSGLYRDTMGGSTEYTLGLNAMQLSVLDILDKLYSTTSTLPVPPFTATTNYYYGMTSDSKIGTSKIYESQMNTIFNANSAAEAYPTTSVAYANMLTSLDNAMKYYVLVNTTDAFALSYKGEVQYTSYATMASITDQFNGTLNFAGVEVDDGGDDDAYAFSAGTENKYSNGIVWAGASMTNYDTTANEYWAEFTATGVTEPRKTLIKNLPESEESITFDAVMWFAGEAKENVTFVINEYAIAE